MIADLPHEVQDLIFRKLHVKDRAKLLMALPKSAIPFRKTDQHKCKEKHLGILSNAIRKRHLATDKMAQRVKDFLVNTCESEDPTLEEVKSQLQFAKVDISSDYDLREMLYKSTPKEFTDTISKNPEYEKYIFENELNFIIGVLIYGNEPLFMYLLDRKGCTLTKSYIASAVTDIYHTTSRAAVNILLKHIPFSKEQLESLAKKAIEKLEFETYQEILKHL